MEKINGFDYINKPMEMGVKEDGTEFMLIDPFGNTSMYLNGYKSVSYTHLTLPTKRIV